MKIPKEIGVYVEVGWQMVKGGVIESALNNLIRIKREFVRIVLIIPEIFLDPY